VLIDAVDQILACEQSYSTNSQRLCKNYYSDF